MIELDQLLHGYENGHSLLAGSRELPPEIEREILSLSDLSGYGMLPGFQEYITGYPLRSIRLYALAKTWYAAEMPRPGCVWTHTILVPFSAFDLGLDILGISTLYSRPARGNYSDYAQKIRFSNSERRSWSGISREVCAELAQRVYTSRGKPTFIGSENPIDLEAALLKLWEYQWPRLQRVFSFCTGTLGPRTLAGKPLNLQVVPPNLRLPIAEKLYLISQKTNALLPSWAQTLGGEMADDKGLLEFIRFFGDDTPVKFSSLPVLIKTYEVITDRPLTVERAVIAATELERGFPKAVEGGFLKRRIFDDALFSPEETKAAVVALCVIGDSESLSEITSGIETRGFTFARDHASWALDTFADVRMLNSHVSDRVCCGIAAGIDSAAIAHSALTTEETIDLVRRNLELLYSPELWNVKVDTQCALAIEILHSWSDRVSLALIFDSVIFTGSLEAIRRLIKEKPREYVNLMLNSLAKKREIVSRERINDIWAMIREWKFESSRWILFNISDALSMPGSLSFLASEIASGMNFTNSDLLLASKQPHQEMDVLIVCVALNSREDGSWRLLPERFELVHRFAEESKLSEASLEILDIVLPPVLREHHWDVCSRFRVEFLKSFDRANWAGDTLGLIIESEDLAVKLERTYQELRKEHAVSNRLDRYFRMKEDSKKAKNRKWLSWLF